MDSKIDLNIANLRKAYDVFRAMPEPNITLSYVEVRSKIINGLWSKIDANHTIIFESYDAEGRKNVEYLGRDEYEQAFNIYEKALFLIQKKLEKFKPTPTPPAQITLPANLALNTANNKANIKLKPIDIPSFSGDYTRWISFKNMFDSLIHNDVGLSKLQKMHYLKSCLEGDAGRIVSQYSITDADYDVAYAAVTERYHNEVILVNTHITTLISQPNLKEETSNGIKELLDVTNENIHALTKLNIDTSTWDPILLLLLVPKLDPSTKRLWDLTLKPNVKTTLNEFLDFLKSRFNALGCQQNIQFSVASTLGVPQQSNQKSNNYNTNSSNNRYSSSNYKSNQQNHDFPPRVHQNYHNSAASTQKKCPFLCGGTHNVLDCEKFNKAEVRMKCDYVSCAKLCKNCLRSHSGKCSARPGCQKCGKYHHTLLHFGKSDSSSSNRTVSDSRHQPQQPFSPIQQDIALKPHHAHLQKIGNQSSVNINDRRTVVAWDEPVLLVTAIILVKSARDNVFYPFRALLDQASEASYVSEYLIQFLGLKRADISAATTGLGGVTTGKIKNVVDFEIGSKRNPSFHLKVQAPVVSKVTNPLPSTRLHKVDWKHIEDLHLADPDFHVPGIIDILLGASVYGYLLLPGLRKMSPDMPVAQNTEFGWILSGPTRSTTSLKHNLASFHLRVELDDQLKKFFELEEVSHERILTQEEVKCDKFFKETVQRNEEGRVIVALPFKKDPKHLGHSKGQAISRLMKLEARLKSNKDLKAEYSDILDEYESLGHTSLLGNLTHIDTSTDSLSYYLPHHAVFKPESTTTKTRVVFDASAKTTAGNSLNDLLMTGPTLQEDLVSIIMRWRIHKIVFSADIAKMYRQVLVREEDRKFERFLFRKGANEPIQVYQHNMVTFGVASATYLAIAALRQVAIEEKEKYPEASEIILRDFYMDDGMSGADSVQEGIKLCKDLKELLARGKFELRKFSSNSAELLESIPEKDRELKLPLWKSMWIKLLRRWEFYTTQLQIRFNLKST